MKWIGLTGGIATGKSSVARFLKEINQASIDADEISKEALFKGSEIYEKVVAVFGKEILTKDQQIDRKKLGRKVFKNKNFLIELENLIHPYVQKRVKKKKTELKDLGYEFCFYEIPLLFEKKLEKNFDAVILVYAPYEIQKKRLLKRDLLSEEEAEERLKNQIPIEKKIKMSKWVLKNEGTLDELKKKTENLFKNLKSNLLKKSSLKSNQFHQFFKFILTFCFLFSISFLNSSFLKAKERKEFYNDVRSLGMGGARVAPVSDGSALLLNPSALGKLRDPTLELVNPEISLNNKVLEIVNFNLFRSFNIKEIFEQLKEKKGSFFHQKLQIFPSFSFKNFGLGMLLKFELDEEILDDARKAVLEDKNKEIFVSYNNDIAFATGFSLPFYDGRLKVGAGLRFVNRIEIEEFFTSEEMENISLKSLAHEGFGVAKDIGVTFSLPRTFIPTFAAVIRDLGDTKYDFLEGFFYSTNKRPKKTPQSLDLGFSMISIFQGTKIITFSTEIRDLFNSKEKKESDIMRRIHGGVEFNLHDSLFFRLGINQRYWTAGFEFAKVNYQLQFAVYGEEIGTSKHPKESRRVNLKFTFRI